MLIEAEVSGEIDEILALFEKSPKKTDRAINRALRKLSRWAERNVLRDMSHRVNVTMKILKNLNRIKVKLKNGYGDNQYLTIWVGLNEIGVHNLGKVKQTARGVRIGRSYSQDGAFLMQPVKADTDLVWMRNDYASKKWRKSKRSGRWMMMSLPIEKQSVRIDQEAELSLKKIEPKLIERFTDLLYQELNYVFNVES